MIYSNAVICMEINRNAMQFMYLFSVDNFSGHTFNNNYLCSVFKN